MLRQVVEAGVRNGMRVLAVARQEKRLRQLARDVPGAEILALDATDESAPAGVFETLTPDILVVAAGSFPPAAPLHEQSWQQFSVNWETSKSRFISPRRRCRGRSPPARPSF
jgi:NADP-dependent 3-hydroxy acid dehydrogenase YdfG